MRTITGRCTTMRMAALTGCLTLLLLWLSACSPATSTLVTPTATPTISIEQLTMPYLVEATKVSLTATQVHTLHQMEIDRATQDAKVQAATWWAFVPLCGTMGLIGLALYLVYSWASNRIKVDVYLGRINETRVGTVAWIGEEPVLLGAEQPRVILTNKPPSVPNVRENLTISTQSEDLTELAKQLTLKGEGQVLPGWRKMGWSSGRWQRVVSALRQAGVKIETDPTSTRLIDATAKDVYYALDLGKLVL